MAAHEISDDKEYRKWVGLHPNGYVLNTGAKPDAGEAILHIGSCMHISDHKKGSLAGKAARKFVADTKAEMREMAKTLGRPVGKRWSSCGSCDA